MVILLIAFLIWLTINGRLATYAALAGSVGKGATGSW